MQHSDIDGSPKAQELDFIEDPLNPRSKTSLRMLYEAQVAVIQKQIGDLENDSHGFRAFTAEKCRSFCWWIHPVGLVGPEKEIKFRRIFWRAFAVVSNFKRKKSPVLTPQYFYWSGSQGFVRKNHAEDR